MGNPLRSAALPETWTGHERHIRTSALGLLPTLKLVFVVRSPDAARLIADPMRRAILNLLRRRALTEAELAENLGLTDATVNYHLRLLRKSGFITVSRTEPEEHGILQKFYSPSAFLYLPDVRALPKEAARYYYPVNVERIRGVLSAIDDPLRRLSKRGAEVDELAEELAEELVNVAQRYRNTEVEQGGGEALVLKLYAEALRRLLKE